MTMEKLNPNGKTERNALADSIKQGMETALLLNPLLGPGAFALKQLRELQKGQDTASNTLPGLLLEDGKSAPETSQENRSTEQASPTDTPPVKPTEGEGGGDGGFSGKSGDKPEQTVPRQEGAP